MNKKMKGLDNDDFAQKAVTVFVIPQITPLKAETLLKELVKRTGKRVEWKSRNANSVSIITMPDNTKMTLAVIQEILPQYIK